MTQKTKAATNAGALAGFRVIDLTRVLGGPYCTQILGDHGATIIKVEPPQGDETRGWGPPFRDGFSSYFVNVNRNKRSLGLDLTKAEGRDVLMRLLDGADALIENFKPGTMERWGIGYDVLSAKYPRLIHCRISGFGATGPFGGAPGYDAAVQAWAGLMSTNGSPESGPMRIGTALVDMVTGLYAGFGIMIAAREREISGKGQFLETTLYDCAVALTHPFAQNYFFSGKTPQLTGSAHPTIAPYNLYPTKTRQIFLAVGNDRQFRRLCEELGAPELAEDARFRSNADRQVNRPALEAALKPLLAERDGIAFAERLMEIGVPAGAAMTVPDVFAHPHTIHRDMLVEKDGFKWAGVPIKFERTPGHVRSIPPRFGADGRAILREAGYSPAEIEKLSSVGALYEVQAKAPE